MLRSPIGFLVILFLFSCSNESGKTIIRSTKVNVHLANAYNQKVLLEAIPILDQKLRKIDSASIKERLETRTFEINDSVENLYQVRVANSPMKIVFINDAPEVDIYIDFFNPDTANVKRSPATTSLHEFLTRMRLANVKVESSSTFGGIYSKGNIAGQQKAYRDFVDTVSSPASALYIFNAVDYGNDYAGLRKLINGLHNRFPGHPGINSLKKETDDYISIFEVELNVNDLAPDLTLPDSSGKEFSVSSFKGKYVLLDFWAAWNSNCRILSPEKVKAWNQYNSRNFTILSVSLDPDLEYWKKVIVADKYQWPQMNDPNVWTGKAIKAYKFDSIPFNFLINPEGRIIAKAIYGDSLRKKLSEILP